METRTADPSIGSLNWLLSLAVLLNPLIHFIVSSVVGWRWSIPKMAIYAGVLFLLVLGFTRWARLPIKCLAIENDPYLNRWISTDNTTLCQSPPALPKILSEARASVRIPSGHLTGDEFALLRANGKRLLVQGYSSGVWLPAETTPLIAHTHPWAQPLPPGLDFRALEILEQK